MKNLTLMTLLFLTNLTQAYASGYCDFSIRSNELLTKRIEAFMLSKLNVGPEDIQEIRNLKEISFIPNKYKILVYTFAPLFGESPRKVLREEPCAKENGLITVDEVIYLKEDQECKVTLTTKLKVNILNSNISSLVKQKYKPVCSAI